MGVGAAAFSERGSQQRRLNHCASIFTAEALALEMALDLVDSSSEKQFLILSDSLSCLRAIDNFNIKDIRILKIYEKLRKVAQSKKVVFAWIPGHTGIQGNEEADSLAKNSKTLNYPHNIKIPHIDFRPVTKKEESTRFNNHWGGLRKNKLKEIMPNIKPGKNFNLPRHIESLITRLRIGHTALTHRFLLEGEPPPFCIGCNEDMTVKHILIGCVDFAETRKKFFRTVTLKDLFDVVDPLRIFSFIREIGLIGKV